MRTYKLDPLTAVIVVFLIVGGALALFVGLPIVGINWAWNACLSGHLNVPTIVWWQAGLLYAALACIIYLSVPIHIEFKTENSD